MKRCYALSGIYDMRDSMDGMYDDNFYFNNPVDYMANQNDPWFLHQYRELRHPARDRHWSVGEQRADLPNARGAPRARGIAHHLDDWGPKGGARMALLAPPDVGIRWGAHF